MHTGKLDRFFGIDNHRPKSIHLHFRVLSCLFVAIYSFGFNVAALRRAIARP